MTRVLVPLAEGFEEIEAVTVIDILRRAEVDVVVAGLGSSETDRSPVVGSQGIRVVADLDIRRAEATGPYDMIVLPGGAEGTRRLRENAAVRKIVDAIRASGGHIAAICAAPTALHAFGAIAGRAATCHPSVAESMAGVDLRDDRVVVDGDLVTSRAAGTAMEFAFRLVEILAGEEVRDRVNAGVLARL